MNYRIIKYLFLGTCVRIEGTKLTHFYEKRKRFREKIRLLYKIIYYLCAQKLNEGYAF